MCLGKQEVLEALQAKKDVKAAVIASEKHEDGTPHIHAYVLLHKRFNCRDPLFWDLQGYHGNYQKAKSIDSVIRYIKKDGDILEFGEISWAERSTPGRSTAGARQEVNGRTSRGYCKG